MREGRKVEEKCNAKEERGKSERGKEERGEGGENVNHGKTGG